MHAWINPKTFDLGNGSGSSDPQTSPDAESFASSSRCPSATSQALEGLAKGGRVGRLMQASTLTF